MKTDHDMGMTIVHMDMNTMSSIGRGQLKGKSNSGRNSDWHSSESTNGNEGIEAAVARGRNSTRSAQLQHAMYMHLTACSAAHPSAASVAIVNMVPNQRCRTWRSEVETVGEGRGER